MITTTRHDGRHDKQQSAAFVVEAASRRSLVYNIEDDHDGGVNETMMMHGMIALDGCKSAMTSNDRNGDGRLTSFEFMTFFQHLQALYMETRRHDDTGDGNGGTIAIVCNAASIIPIPSNVSNNNNNNSDAANSATTTATNNETTTASTTTTTTSTTTTSSSDTALLHDFFTTNNNNSTRLTDFMPGGVYYQLFFQAACLCQSYDVLDPHGCCSIPTIRVPSTSSSTTTTTEQASPIQQSSSSSSSSSSNNVYDDGYYMDICFLLSRQIQQQECNASTAATLERRSPAPSSNNSIPQLNETAETTEEEGRQQQLQQKQQTDAYSSGGGNGAAPAPPHWQIYLLIPILFVLTGWIVWLVLWDKHDPSRGDSSSHEDDDDNDNNKKASNGDKKDMHQQQHQQQDATSTTYDAQGLEEGEGYGDGEEDGDGISASSVSSCSAGGDMMIITNDALQKEQRLSITGSIHDDVVVVNMTNSSDNNSLQSTPSSSPSSSSASSLELAEEGSGSLTLTCITTTSDCHYADDDFGNYHIEKEKGEERSSEIDLLNNVVVACSDDTDDFDDALQEIPSNNDNNIGDDK
jgi:hypothetical protein